MNSYPFTHDGVDYSFKKLDDMVKDFVTDHMSADRIMSVTRMLQQGLITTEAYKLERAANLVKWHSAEFAHDIMLPKYRLMLVRQLLNDSQTITDEQLEEMAASVGMQTALETCIEDSQAKKTKPV